LNAVVALTWLLSGRDLRDLLASVRCARWGSASATGRYAMANFTRSTPLFNFATLRGNGCAGRPVLTAMI
jgi:hypothetical protein